MDWTVSPIPQRKICWSPNPWHLGMWPLLAVESYRGNQAREVIGVAPDPVWLVSHKKRRFGHRCMWTWRCPSASQGERPGTDFPSQPSDGTNPADCLISDFQTPELWGNAFTVSRQLVVLCYGSPMKQENCLPYETSTLALVFPYISVHETNLGLFWGKGTL